MFTLTNEQKEKLEDWLSEQYQLAVDNQKQTVAKDDPIYWIYESCWDEGYPYCGAIGIAETYEFTPTSIGLIVKVKYKDAEIDLTEYDNW
jgi:hypothetical protein